MSKSHSDKKQSSTRQQEASRLNGAKSRGPVTPEGKDKVSRNAVKHGYLAKVVTLSPEDESAFREIHERYVLRFEPRDQVEHDLVEEIVWAKWKMRKMWIHETSIVGLQVALDRDKVNMEWIHPNEHDREALATVECLKDSKALDLFQRYNRTLSTQAEKATKLLLELKKLRLPPAVVPPMPGLQAPSGTEPEAQEPNRPNPEIEHPEIETSEPVSYVRNDAVQLRQRTQSAIQTSKLTTAHQPLTTSFELATDNWQLATEKATSSELATDNWQLATQKAMAA